MKFLQKINIGHYLPIDSTIHRLDPRIKIFVLFAFMVWIISIDLFTGYILPVLFIFFTIILSNINIKYSLRNIFALKYLFIFTWILHIFFSEGTDTLWSWGIINITSDGLKLGTLITLRLIFLILGATLFTLTTSPIQITDAFESLFSPLKIIGFPAHEIAMMLTISFRFIPILFMEVDKIMKAQMCRGVDFKKGNIVDRVNTLIPIFIPLFLNSFRRAEELALAMDARCYKGGEGRSHFRELSFSMKDFCALSVFILILSAHYVYFR